MSKRGQIEVIARGVVRLGRWLLVCRNLKGGYWYLPGGHVEFGEAAATALKRELLEEARLRTLVGSLMLVTEGKFRTGRRDHHEINLVFHVELPKRAGKRSASCPPPVASREAHIGFDWLDLVRLRAFDLRPLDIRDWLATSYQSGARSTSSTWNTSMR